MKLTVHTERGVFESAVEAASAEQLENIVDLLQQISSGAAEYFKFKTNTGHAIIGKDLLASSVFVISDDEPIPQA